MGNPRETSLSDSELADAKRELRNWSYNRDRRALYRRIEMADFPQAIAFMVRVAMEAEKVNHHPEWSNVYNRVDIWLTTHSVQGVSDRDVVMARHIDTIIGE
jgi:4a-hydroxytetrahydrobiopterin dehydratase